MAELREWVQLYKDVRELLFTGDRVRVDLGDESVALHGVVASDASRALFSFTALSRSDANQTGRLYFPGLDDEARYKLEVLMPGAKPSGYVPSPVISNASGFLAPTPGNAREYERLNAELHERGITDQVLGGRAWASVGITTPILNPENTVLFQLTRVS